MGVSKPDFRISKDEPARWSYNLFKHEKIIKIEEEKISWYVLLNYDNKP